MNDVQKFIINRGLEKASLESIKQAIRQDPSLPNDVKEFWLGVIRGYSISKDVYDLLDYLNRRRNMKITEVVAALIWNGDKFMICQRPVHKARGLLWEFVGGKVEPGETKEQALIRECREELAVTLSVGDVFMDVIHEYPDLTVHLTLFNATIAEGESQKLEHNDIQWITPSEIPNYEFCPADEEILVEIIERYGNTV